MKYKIKTTSSYRKGYKKAIKRGLDISKLDTIILLLADDVALPESNLDHELKGKWQGYRECHIEPDWLLIYQKDKDVLILILADTGTHAELFGD